MPLHWVDPDVTGHNRWDEVVTNFLVIIGISLENLKKCLKKVNETHFLSDGAFVSLYYFISFFPPLWVFFLYDSHHIQAKMGRGASEKTPQSFHNYNKLINAENISLLFPMETSAQHLK